MKLIVKNEKGFEELYDMLYGDGCDCDLSKSLTEHLIKPINYIENHILKFMDFRVFFQRLLDFLGLGNKKHQKINYDPEGMLTPDQVQAIDDFVQQEIMIPGHKLEEAAIKSFLTGRVLNAMKNKEKAQIDWSGLPGTILQAMKEKNLMPAEVNAVKFAMASATVGMKNLSNSASSLITDTVIQSQLGKWGYKRLEQELKSKIVDTDSNLNRDWRRAAITMANNTTQNGVLASIAPGRKVIIVSHPDACDWCLSNLNGKEFIVRDSAPPEYQHLNPDSEEYKKIAKIWDEEIWIGKTNIGRSQSPMKRLGGVLVPREHHELWMPTLTAHPHCRCFYQEKSELE